MNEYELKIQALTESLGELTVKYEDKIANLRVEVTILRKQNEEFKAALEGQNEEATVVPSEESK